MVTVNDYTTIKLRKEVKQELSKMGNVGQTYSDVVHGLIKSASSTSASVKRGVSK